MSDDQAAPNEVVKFTPVLLFTLRVVIAGALVGVGFSLFSRYWYVAELFTHFFPYYFSLSLLALALSLSTKKWAYALGSLGLLIYTASTVAPIYIGKDSSDSDIVLRIVTANVNSRNPDSAAFLDFVRQIDPDVLFVQEIDDRWAAELRDALDALPHRIAMPKQDNFGIGLYSRYPFVEDEILDPTNLGLYEIHATIEISGKRISLANVHSMPPGGAELARIRNDQLEQLADKIATDLNSAIVAGDLNVTPWSPYLRDFIVSSNLRDARKGSGIQATWPAQIPLRIPIDHVLVTKDFLVKRFRRGPNIGSDHLPLAVELGWND